MKKLLLIALLGLFGFKGIAQDQQQSSDTLKRHEIHINALYILMGIPDFTYERILNSESGIGISVAFNLDNDVDLNFLIIPHYRIYFGKKYASGFFLEANTAIMSEPDYQRNKVTFGLGFAAGGKFLTKSGWVGELFLGLGRNLIKPDRAMNVYPRFGITIGKRF